MVFKVLSSPNDSVIHRDVTTGLWLSQALHGIYGVFSQILRLFPLFLHHFKWVNALTPAFNMYF